MLDPARLTEKMSVYQDFIPQCAEWGYNTIFWHFTDDDWSASQGCALRFPSHPELAAKFAFSTEEMKSLIELAAKHGMQIIPEVECIGHTGYIRRKYPHLADRAEGREFGAIAPFHPETRKILEDLLTDTARIFPAPYIHVGMDETAFGDHPHTKALLAGGKKKWELVAEHIEWLHSIVCGKLGKTMMMWGDLMLPEAESDMSTRLDTESYNTEIARHIPKDIVICDWHYQPAKDFPTLDFFLQQGFRVIASAATRAYGSIFYPADWNLQNIRDFTAAAWRRKDQEALLGVMNCVWAPQTDMTGNLLVGMALGGECQQHGSEEPDFFSRFAETTFGLPKAEADMAGRGFQLLSKVSPHQRDFTRVMPVRENELGRISSDTKKAIKLMGEGGKEALQLLSKARPAVARWQDYFDDILFTAKCFASIADRVKALIEVAGKSDRTYLQEIVRNAEALAEEGRRLWPVHRHEDDPELDGDAVRGGCGAMQQRLTNSALFIKRFEREPALLLSYANPA